MSGSAALLDVDGVDEWRGVDVEMDEEVGDAEDENKKPQRLSVIYQRVFGRRRVTKGSKLSLRLPLSQSAFGASARVISVISRDILNACIALEEKKPETSCLNHKCGIRRCDENSRLLCAI